MLYMSIMKLHMSTLAGILDDDYEITKTDQFAVTCIHGNQLPRATKSGISTIIPRLGKVVYESHNYLTQLCTGIIIFVM